MKKIAYVLPYFGKFPKGFKFYLMSCGNNPTIEKKLMIYKLFDKIEL